jgi:hypothetical protein
VRVEVSQVIDRPVADVFRFYAADHVRNHQRWDPDMELVQVSDGPIGGGMDESMDAGLLTRLIERSARNIKDLIESEM